MIAGAVLVLLGLIGTVLAINFGYAEGVAVDAEGRDGNVLPIALGLLLAVVAVVVGIALIVRKNRH